MTLEVTEASPVSDPNAETVQQTAATEAATPEDANPAQSSDADNEDAKQEPLSLRDVIQNVVAKPEAPEESSTPEAKEEVAEPEAKAEGEGDDPDANVPFHNHPRFKQVLQERDSYKADADQYRNITTFMDTHSLKGEEVAEGFEIMALLKSADPERLVKAREWFSEKLQHLDTVLGHELPADLRQEVEDGYVTEERARELSQTRAKAALLETRSAEQVQQSEQRQQQETAVAAQREMVSAVTAWETQITAKDPDFAAKKAPLVQAQVLAIVKERGGKYPQTRDEAVEVAQAAYDRVNDALKSMLPKPKPITPPVAGLSATARPEPKSLREAIQAVL